MMHVFCKLCLNSVPVADWKCHITQKQHLQQLPYKIIVKGSFKKDEVDEVYKYFEKFGGIRGQNVTFADNETVIEYRFWDARVYSTVIHQEHVLFEQELIISWYKKVKSGPLQHVIPDQKMQNEKFVYRKLAVINDLNELKTFTDQLQFFQNKLENIRNEANKNRQIIRENLTTDLAQNFRHTQIQFFGSSITDLDIHDSDLNVYINNTDSEISTLELIKNLISKSENFTDACLSSQQEITFHHKKTKILCNLNIKNELPVGNSELIKFYLTLDEKLRLFILVIKFWADCNELRGENCFSSYAIYAMVIFFLQQEPYKLPSVVELQRDLPSDEIDNWNCAFGPVEYRNYHLENATILGLVEGFFKFYSGFYYISQVISPYFGSMIDKTRFISPPDLPECFEDYLNQDKILPVNEGFCIQDFFELSKNVSTISLSCSGRFVALCRNSLQLIVSEEKKLLSKLFGQDSGVNEFYLMNVNEQIIRKRVSKVLKEVFGCEVEETMSDEGFVYHCKGERNVWDNRIQIMKSHILKNSPDICKEKKDVAITTHLMKNYTENVIWKMVVVLKFETGQRVKVVLREEENLSVILHLQHFLYVILRDSCAEEEPENDIPMEFENEITNEMEVEDQAMKSNENAKKQENLCVSNEDSANDNLGSRKVGKKSENYNLLSKSDIIKENFSNLNATKPCEENMNKKFEKNENEVMVTEEIMDEDMSYTNLSVTVSEHNSSNDVSKEILKSNNPETMKPGEDSGFKKENEYKMVEKETGSENSSEGNLNMKISKNIIVDGNSFNNTLGEISTLADNSLSVGLCKENDTNAETVCTMNENSEEKENKSEGTVDVRRSETVIVDEKSGIKIEEIPLSSKQEIEEGNLSSTVILEGESSQAERENLPNVSSFPNDFIPKEEWLYENAKFENRFSYNNTILEDKANAAKFEALKFAVSKRIRDIPTFNAQLTFLVEQLKSIDSEFSKSCEIVRHDLSQLLISAIPQVELHFYGSSTTGLNIHNELKVVITPAAVSLDLIKDIINACDKFQNVAIVGIEKSRIKFTHVETKTSCKLVLKKELLKNNELLSYVLSLDERIRDLMLVVKFWVKCYDLMAVNYPSIFIYFLVIFYLQQEPYNMPSLEQLQKNSSDSKPTDYDSSVLRSATIGDLVTGFFRFYESFDYIKFVISPFYGRPIEKTIFLAPPGLPQLFEQLNDCTSICVQDCYDLSKNLVHDMTAWTFVQFCRGCVTLMETGESKLLYRLLNEIVLDRIIYLKKNDDRQDQEWIKCVKIMILRISKEVFACNVQEMDNGSKRLHFVLRGTIDVFKERTTAAKMISFHFPSNGLQREIAMTRYIVKNCPKKKKKCNWTMHVTLVFLVDPCRVKIGFTCWQNRNLVKLHYDHFVRFNLEKFLAQDLTENETGNSRSADGEVMNNSTVNRTYEDFKEFVINGIRNDLFEDQLSTFLKIHEEDQRTFETKYALLHKDLQCEFKEFCVFGSSDFGPNRILDMYVDAKESPQEKLSKCDKFYIHNLARLECTHVSTQVEFRISMKRGQVYNAELVRYYVSLDEKIRHVFLLVRFWTNCSIFKNISKYTLDLMLIFFLQQEPYNLPPIRLLQKDEAPVIIDGWNYGFASLEITSPALQKTTTLDLLTGFFAFYSNFDYFTLVISPYFGFPVEKTSFVKSGSAVEQGLCIQDAFVLDQSITSSNSHNHFGKFISLCHKALASIEKGEKLLLSRLFEQASNNSYETINSFTIKKRTDLNDEEWTNLFKQVFWRIFSEVLGHDVIQKGGMYVVPIAGFRKNGIDILKMRLPSTVNGWRKERIVASCIFRDHDGRPQHINITFHKHPSRMAVQLMKNHEWACYYMHFLYTRLMMFLPSEEGASINDCTLSEKQVHQLQEDENSLNDNVAILEKQPRNCTQAEKQANDLNELHVLSNEVAILEHGSFPDCAPEKQDNVDKVDENSSTKHIAILENKSLAKKQMSEPQTDKNFFADEVAILEKEISDCRDRIEQQHRLIVEDLSSALLSLFPQMQIHIYDTTVGSQNLKIYLSHIDSLELMKCSMNKSDKFDELSFVSKYEIFMTCKHVLTNIYCHVNVKTKLPLFTSNLIKFYLGSDERFTSLMKIIIQWIHSIRKHMSMDIVSLMVIFFLQQEPYRLPSVVDLQMGAPIDLIDGWNCGYKRESILLIKDVSIFDLVLGFFEFYAYFDYASYVICPYLGSAIKKTCFLKPYDLPECYQQYVHRNEEMFVDMSFNIQDPFQHNKNFLNVMGGIGDFSCFSYAMSKQLKTDKSFNILGNSYYGLESEIILKRDDEDEEKWEESVKGVLLKILTEVFDYKVANESKADDGYSYLCRGRHVVWNNRIYAEKTLLFPMEFGEIDKEIAISSVFRNLFPHRMHLRCKVLLKFEKNPCRVRVHVFKRTDLKRFIKSFLYSKMRRVLRSGDHRSELCLSGRSEIFEAVTQNTFGFDERVALLQEKFLMSEREIGENCKMIENHLRAILPSKKIVIDTSLNFRGSPLKIFIESESSLSEMKDLINMNESFRDSTIVSSIFLRCKHVKTDTICDINVTDEASVETTRLIKYYLSLDDKMIPLVILIKFWADSYKLTDVYRFSDKEVMMMVIFFLQQEPYNLPPASDLQQETSYPEFKNPIFEKATIVELFAKFLEFYSKFDYFSYVVSPYYGSPIEKIRFLKPYDLPECYNYYICKDKELDVDTFICIQDFFDHSKNLSSVFTYLPGHFASVCRNSLENLNGDESEFFRCFSSCDYDFRIRVERNHNMTLEKVMIFVENIFREVFHCQISKESQSETDIRYACEGQFNIWNKRVRCMKKLQVPVNCGLDGEAAVTARVVEDFPEKLIWKMSVGMEFTENELVLTFFKKKEFYQLYHVCHFIYIKLIEAFPKTQKNEIDVLGESQICSLENIDENKSVDAMEIDKSASCDGNENETDNQILSTTSEIHTKENIMVINENPSSTTSEIHTEKNLMVINEKSSSTTSEIHTKENLMVINENPSISASDKKPENAIKIDEASSGVVTEVNQIVGAVNDDKTENLIKMEVDVAASKTSTEEVVENLPSGGIENPIETDENPSADIYDEDAILDAIKSAASFTEQATILRTFLQTSTLDTKSIISDFTDSLPETEIYLFGSRLTGLEVASSDVNICIIPHKRAETTFIQMNDFKRSLVLKEKFSDVIIIESDGRMKLSVIKCVHKATQKSCLVYIHNKIVVRNSELIKYYLNLEENFRTFFICVHFWVERHLPGQFSKRSLNLMIIFFLQQSPYKVSSVFDLQKNIVPESIAECNCAFAELRTDPLETTVHELMGRFFKFYGDFDYFSFVISPYFGRLIAKTRFLKPYILPAAYRMYAKQKYTLDVNTVLCVQDPFQHKRNIVEGMSAEGVSKFAALCRRAYGLTQQINNSLHDLLLPKSFDQVCEFSIEKKEDEDELDWRELIKKLISNILTKIFRGTIASTNILSPDSLSYQCQGFVDVWDKRTSVLKTVLEQLHRNAKSIEKEIAVSSHCANLKEKHKAWTLVVDVVFTENKVSVSFKESQDVFHFCHLMYTRLVRFLKEEKTCQLSKDIPSEVCSASTEKVLSQVGKEGIDTCSHNENEKSKVELVLIESNGEKKDLSVSETKHVNVQTCEEEIIPSTSTPSLTESSSTSEKKKNKKYKVIKSTKDNLTFADQVAYFTSNLLLDQEQIESDKKIICDDLIEILTPHLNFDKIYFFGSSFTRLFTEESKFHVYIENIRKRPGPGPKLVLKEILLKSKKFDFFLISGKIINCKHAALGVQCEIHFNNRLPVCTTLLIHYYLSFDPKLRTFMFLIKSWADFYQLKQQSHLSHYALCLMVIFYLQQPPYNLPSVYTLQNNLPPDMVEFWNCSFDPKEFKNPVLENTTVLDLLSGFFTFYSTFDYFTYVIAPFFGSPIDKTCFVPPLNLPECYFYYIRNGKLMYVDCSVCVQDVFEHSTNVARAVTLKSLGRFAALCRGALQILSAGEKLLLHRLMYDCQTGDSVDFQAIEIARTGRMDPEKWLPMIQSVIFVIITEVLCCNVVKVQHKEMNRGRKMLKVGKKFRNDVMDQFVYDCVGQWRIWENRIHILKAWIEKINPMASCMDKDIFVSKCLRSDVKNMGRWDLKVEVILMRNPACVRLMLNGGESKLYVTQFIYTRILSALVQNDAQISAQEKLNANPLLSAFSEPYKLLIKELRKDKVNQVIEHFSPLGPVIVNQKIIDDKEKVSIEYCFAEADAYLRFLTQEHIVSDEKLKVVPLSLLKEKISNVNFQDFRLSVIHKVTEASTFNKQMSIFRQENEPMKEHRQRVLNYLSSMFEAKFFTLDFDVESDLKIFVESQSITLEKMKNELEADVKFAKVSLNNSVVKCQHVQTRFCCSIRIGDKLMAANSRLLKYYSSLDSKLELLMNVIFFWANSYDLMPDDNFWFSLLIIFYLQQEYKLPSVQDLQENTIPEFIKGWNCSYAEFIEYSNPSLESTNFFDLVHGFFKFYERFDYISYLISPYHGKFFEKIVFSDLPEQLRVDINCGLVIQDLFEHSRNVSINVSQDSVGKFTCLCRSALALIEQGQKFLLHRLFLHCMNSSVVDFPGFEVMKPLEKGQEEWIKSVNRITLKILSDVLSYKLTLIPVFNAQRVSYGCVGRHDVWKGRINALKTLSTQLREVKEIEKETAVTTCVIRELSHEGWNVFVDLTFRTEPCGVKVVFTRKNGYFDLFHVCQFIYTRLERFLKDEMNKEIEDASKNHGNNVSSSLPPEVQDQCDSQGAADCEKKDEHIASGCDIYESIDEDNQDTIKENKYIRGKMKENITKKKNEDTNEYKNDDIPTKENSDAITETTSKHEAITELNDNITVQENENFCKEQIEDISSSEIDLTEEGKIVDQEEDDDVPSDFFDDFAREDFLDGLDIVDVWDEDCKISITHKTKKEKKKKKKKKSKTPERGRRRTRTRSRDRRRRSSSDSSRERLRKRRRSSSGSSRERSRKGRRSPSPYECERRRRNLGYRPRRRRSSSRDSRRSDSYSPSPKRRRKTFLEEIQEKLNEMKPRTSPAPVICDLPAVEGVSLPAAFPPLPKVSPLAVFPSMELPPPPGVTSMTVSSYTVLPPPPMKHVQYLKVPPVAMLPFPLPPFPVVAPPTRPPLFPTTHYPPLLAPRQFYPENCFLGNLNTWPETPFPPPLPMEDPVIPPPPPEAPVSPPTPIETVSRLSNVRAGAVREGDPLKLFSEKKISFSDFLSLTAKKEVLSNCHTIVKMLTQDPQLHGRLRVKPPSETKAPRYQSPLKKLHMVKFTLTTPPQLPEGENVFSEAINRVLQAVGLGKKVGVENDDIEDVIDVVFRELGNSEGDRQKVVQILKRHLMEESVESAVNDIGTQCVVAKKTCTVGLQVEETELSPRKKTIRYANGRST